MYIQQLYYVTVLDCDKKEKPDGTIQILDIFLTSLTKDCNGVL